MSKPRAICLCAVAGILTALSPVRSFAAKRLPSAETVFLVEDEGKTEEKVEIDKLPAAVTETVTKEVPDGKITEASKVTKKGKTYYEIDVKAGDTEYEIKTSLEGKFKSKKVEEKDEKEEKN